jgi:hypothetical protein
MDLPRIMLMQELGTGCKNQQKNAADAYQPSPTAILFWIEQTPAHVNECNASLRPISFGPKNMPSL